MSKDIFAVVAMGIFGILWVGMIVSLVLEVKRGRKKE